MKRVLFVAIIVMVQTICTTATAGELIDGATITSLAGASNNQEEFSIRISGGAGPCAGTIIKFPVASSPSLISWNHVFALANTALENGKTIRVYNYIDNDCGKATYLQVYR